MVASCAWVVEPSILPPLRITHHASPIHLTYHDIYRADVGYHVGHHASLGHEGQRLEVDEGGGAVAGPVGVVLAVGYYVPAKLTLGRLDGRVVLAHRGLEAVHHQDEVALHGLDAGHRLFLGGEGDP